MEFESVLNALIEQWADVVSDLADAGTLTKPYYAEGTSNEIPFYVTDWFKESGEPHYTERQPGLEQCYSVGRISHTSGTQDPTMPFTAYARTISFELASEEKYRQDIQAIFTEFATRLKTLSSNIGGEAVLFKSDSLPEFGEETEMTVRGFANTKGFRTKWDVLCVVFPNMRLANDYSLNITIYDDSNETIATGSLPFTKMTVSDEIELRADSSARKDFRFKASTVQTGIQVEGLINDGDLCKAIEDDIWAASHFGCTYVAIIKRGTEVIATETWVRKAGSLVYAFGSFVAFSATFVRGF